MCSAIMTILTTLMTFSIILDTVNSLELGISFYPGVNLWVGEKLILECRVAGGKHREQETVIWHRKRDLNG